MPPLRINQFGGMLPAWDDSLLPDDQATQSRDTYLYSGSINGWRRPKPLHRLVDPAASFVYRIPTQAQAIAHAHLIFQDNPVEGDTVTVGEETYTFTATVTNAYDVLLGSDATTSAQNLIGALTLNGVFDQQFGQGTCVNPALTGNSPWVGLPFSITNGVDAPGANTLFLIPVEPSGTMKAIDVAIMPVTTDPTAKFRGVIYANSLGIPGSLLTVGNEVVGCTAFKPIVSTLPTKPYLQQGDTYWIGFMTDSAVTIALADNGANGSKAAVTYSDGPVPVAPTMSPLLVDWQIWTDMVTIASSDPINTLGVTVNLPGDPFPEIIMEAPDFGLAYNTTRVSTTSSNLVWLTDDVSFSHTTATLQGGTNQTQDDSITGASIWLEFDDPDTTVVRSPVVDDSFQRYYVASPSKPPMYNTYDRIVNGDPPWLLGVPTPGCTPNLSVTGGGNASTVGLAAANSTNEGAVTGDNLILVQVSPTGDMSLNDVSMTPAQDLTTARFTAVVYSDNLGRPGTFIGQGAEQTGCTAGQTLSSVFTVPIGLSSGIQYWIGFIIDTSLAIMLSDDLGNAATRSGAATYDNGPPVDAPTTTVAGPDWQIWGDVTTQAVLETRSYIYTWVTDYGEEGQPSPPVTETGWSNSTWTIGLFTPTPDEMGVTRNITRTRLYRTVSGQQQTTFFFVAEFAVTTAFYVDVADDSVIAQNFQVASTNWTGPPEGLLGIARMANGIMVGFKGNELWFSEAYQPHAWPARYVITADFPIVGVGVTGTAVVACTTSKPMVASGVNPALMTATKIEIVEPCISRGSIVSTDSGVFYASPNGLIHLSASAQGGNSTETWIRREKWQALTPQKNLRAVHHISSYFAFGSINGADHSVAQDGYTIELSLDSQSFTIWPQAGGHRIGFSELTAPNLIDIRNVQIDPWSGVCMLVEDDGNVYYYDFSDPAPAVVPYKWRSKQFQRTAKQNLAAFRVFFDVPAGTPPQNPVRTTAAQMGDDIAYAVGMYGIVRVYADSDNDGVMNLITARELRTSGELMRINSGFKSEFWEFEFEGVISVKNIQAGGTVKELAQV